MSLKLYRFEHESRSLYKNNIDFLRKYDMLHNDCEHESGYNDLLNFTNNLLCFPETYKYWSNKLICLMWIDATTLEISNKLNENFKNQYVEFNNFVYDDNFLDIRHLFNSKEIILKWFTRKQLEAIFEEEYKLFEYEFEINFSIHDFYMLDTQTMMHKKYLDNCLNKTQIYI